MKASPVQSVVRCWLLTEVMLVKKLVFGDWLTQQIALSNVSDLLPSGLTAIDPGRGQKMPAN